jgi:hypothetical protein
MSSREVILLALVTASWGVKQPAQAYTVRTEHPRIWLNPSLLTHLRAQATAGSTR